MEAFSIAELSALWQGPTQRKLIGVDWGERRIGVAVSDRSGLIASPLRVVLRPTPFRRARPGKKRAESQKKPRPDTSLEELANIIQQESPIAVILGLPKNMDGSLGFQAEKVAAFQASLQAHITPPILLWDERWSSAAIERLMVSADWSRKQREGHIDPSAAAFVLQGVLDLLNR